MSQAPPSPVASPETDSPPPTPTMPESAVESMSEHCPPQSSKHMEVIGTKDAWTEYGIDLDTIDLYGLHGYQYDK